MFLFAAPEAPPQVTLKPTIEIRERIDQRTDRDFSSAVNDDRADLNSRIRIGVDIKYRENVTGRIQYRYAHDYTFTMAKDYTTDRSDVDQAYLAFKTRKGLLTVGRQNVVKSNHLTFGVAQFGNISTAFDGIRYTNEQWDLFVGRVGIISSTNYPDAYAAFVTRKSKLGETTIIAKQDEAPIKDIEVYALDHRYVGKSGQWTFEAEGIAEIGQSSGKDLEAWAGHAKAQYQINKKWSAAVIGNIGSGGSTSTKTHTFDQLYGSHHASFGQMEMQGWRNMKELAFDVTYKPDAKLNVGLQYHVFQLYDNKDGWYGAGGTLNKRVGGSYIDATGAAGGDVGQEIELCGTYALNKNHVLQFGVAKFLPGSFIKSFNGSATRDQYWCYFGITSKF
jgi:hypothetical protein